MQNKNFKWRTRTTFKMLNILALWVESLTYTLVLRLLIAFLRTRQYPWTHLAFFSPIDNLEKIVSFLLSLLGTTTVYIWILFQNKWIFSINIYPNKKMIYVHLPKNAWANWLQRYKPSTSYLRKHSKHHQKLSSGSENQNSFWSHHSKVYWSFDLIRTRPEIWCQLLHGNLSLFMVPLRKNSLLNIIYYSLLLIFYI